jgi:methylthioribose-1-phosphate isomerase
MLDQRVLPGREDWLELRSHGDVVHAIKDMAVRGAPAIGIAAAYGMALAALNQEDLTSASALLAASRPTAVNLFWALDRIAKLDTTNFETILGEAEKIEAEDLEMNLAIGRHGAGLIQNGWNVLTVCNTGALATGGHGTALGVIRTAHEEGKDIHVYSCETRPRQQGLRLTAYELMKENIPFHSIADSAANGDTANKIGTYSLAVLARHHNIPFFIAAPSSTFDPSLPNGDLIPIEERSGEELTHSEGTAIAPAGINVYNPGFDVTPGNLITAIITEEKVFEAPYSFLPESSLTAM